MTTISLLKHDAQEHDQTAVSLGFLGCSSLYRISIIGVLYCYYHLFSQDFTGWCDNIHIVLMLCFSLVSGLLLYCSSLTHWPLCLAMGYYLTICLMGDHPPFLLIATPIPVAQLVYKAPVDTLYLLMLNLLCIPFLLLLTHPQALSLRLQPELLGHNNVPIYHVSMLLN